MAILLGFASSLAACAASTDFVAGRILVQPRPDVTAESWERLHRHLGASIIKNFNFGGLQLVSVPEGSSEHELLNRYWRSGLAEFAVLDSKVKGASVFPNDPRFLDGTLWALRNDGQHESVEGADIDAPQGWAIRNTASNVIVAVLDTGIRYTHEDLAANIWTDTNTFAHGIDAIHGTLTPWDDEGHGTMVAGIIGAAGNNGIGIAGVAWRVQLMAGKCLNQDNEGSDAAVVECLEYALTNGARIVNASLTSTTASEAVSNAIVNLRDAGVILVVPSGNGMFDIDLEPVFPACYDLDNIVTVMSTGPDDCIGFLSNHGVTNVDLGAPGDRIFSTSFAADDAYFPPNYPVGAGYGSSFAAGYVSGALALMLEQFPGEDYRQIIARLMRATDPLPDLEGKCVTGGRLNLLKALSPPIELQAATNSLSPFQFNVSAGFNRTVVLETSTNLVDWVSFATNSTTTNWSFEITDLPPAGESQRFYRGVSVP